MGENLTVWTIRLALAAYVGILASRIRAPAPVDGNTPRERLQRGIWTLGCILLWAHVASAFAFYHHWSHDDAYVRTARETANTVGIDWGGGIYFNYLFLLLWTFDVAWQWSWPAAYRARSRKYSVLLDAYLAFIVFNATVVFGHRAVRYLGIAATSGIVCLVCIRAFRPVDPPGGGYRSE